MNRTVESNSKPTENNYLNDLQVSKYSKLIFELNDDWQLLASEFPKIFTVSEIERIEKSRETSKSETVLRLLRSEHVPLKSIYSALYKRNLESAYSILEADIPKDWIEKCKSSKMQKSLNNKPLQQQQQQYSGFNLNSNTPKVQTLLNQTSPSSYPVGFGFDSKAPQNDVFDPSSLLNSLPGNTYYQSSFTNPNDSSSFNTSFSGNFGFGQISTPYQQHLFKQNAYDFIEPVFNSTLSNDMMFNHPNLINQQLILNQQIEIQRQQRHKKIENYLSILPIISSEETFVDLSTMLSKYFSGKYSVACLNKRGNIRALKRSFENEIDYLKELEMIKFKHSNLLTVDFVQSSDSSLLYMVSDDVFNLNYYIQNFKRINLSGKNPYKDFTLLIDITSALQFLHSKSIVYNNWDFSRNDSIILSPKSDHYMHAKLSDFQKLKESPSESDINEEFYNYALLIIMIITGNEIEKNEVDIIQYNLKGKTGVEKMDQEYSYTKKYIKQDMAKIYSDKYGDLFKIFLTFSKPNLTLKEKSFEKLNQKLQKQLAELDEQEKRKQKIDEESLLNPSPEPMQQQQMLQQQFNPWQSNLSNPWLN